VENQNLKKSGKIPWVLKFLAKLVITLGALYFVLREVDITRILDLYRNSRPGFLLSAAGLFVLSKVLSAYRLNHLFRSVGVALNDRTNLKLYWLGMYYNIFLPGGIGGDGYKAYLLKRHFRISVKRIVSAILVDRFSGMFVLLLLSFMGFAILLDGLWIQLMLILALPLAYLFYYLVMRRWFAVFKGFIHQINLYSLFVQLLQIAMVLLILTSWGIQFHLLAYGAVFLISSVVAILPVTIGGAGARELTFLFFSQYLIFDLNTAIALSLMFYLVTLLISFGGIAFALRPVKLGDKKLSPEAAE